MPVLDAQHLATRCIAEPYVALGSAKATVSSCCNRVPTRLLPAGKLPFRALMGYLQCQASRATCIDGYLVVPKAQIERFTGAAGQLGGVGSFVSQATVAEFMEQGHFSRHLRKMRALYSQRRSYLVDALTDIFGSRMAVQPQAGGLQVLAYPATGQRDALLAQAAQSHGLPLQALSRWRIRASSSGGLLMGFSSFATREQAYASVQRLRAALDDVLAPVGPRVRAASPRV